MENKKAVHHVIWPIDQDKWSSGWEGVALQHTSQPRQTLRIFNSSVWKESRMLKIGLRLIYLANDFYIMKFPDRKGGSQVYLLITEDPAGSH